MKVLLTGGTGYIGSHTAVVLIEAGFDVVLLDNLSNSSESVVEKIEQITKKRPFFVKVDVRNIGALKKIFNDIDIDIVIHFAGLKSVSESLERPLSYFDSNVLGTINLLSVMNDHDVKNLVFDNFWGCSGSGKLQKIHRGIDPDDTFDFRKFDFFKLCFSLFFDF